MIDKNTVLANHKREQIEVKKIELKSALNDLDLAKKKVEATEYLIRVLEDELSNIPVNNQPDTEEKTESDAISAKSIILSTLDGEWNDGLLIKEIIVKAKRDYDRSISYKHVERSLEKLIDSGQVEQSNPGFTRNKRFRRILSI